MLKERVIVAMSGGIDSSVAAARLVDDGYDVVGVTFHLWDYPDDSSEKSRCCAPEDQRDARRVADFLNIPHYTFDHRDLFLEHVVNPFVQAYLEGKTPSPCIACNRNVKMKQFFPLAKKLNASKIATGHYARIEYVEGTPRLFRGLDLGKDQAYFLHMLNSSELEKVLFPLGSSTKKEVRTEATTRNLPGAQKGESQELCFVTTGEYASFVEKRDPGKIRPGNIINGDGKIIGQHEGIHRFTMGQRKGIGVALGKPAFVTHLNPETGNVTLGCDEDLLSLQANITDTFWSDDVVFPLHNVEVQVRSRHVGERATIEKWEETYRIYFEKPVRAVSPGQIAVVYRGDRVLGGGLIRKSVSNHEGFL